MKNVFLSVIVCSSLGFSIGQAAASSWLKTGGAAKIPAGHFNYCKRGGKHCGNQKAYAPVQMTSNSWKKVRSINAHANRKIKPATDMETRGVAEYWEVARRQGDCEDYSMFKRSKLMSAGFKPSQLPLAKVRLRNGQAHVVLVVRTTEGDFALNNLTDQVHPVSKSGLRFLSIQSATNASKWISVRGYTKNQPNG